MCVRSLMGQPHGLHCIAQILCCFTEPRRFCLICCMPNLDFGKAATGTARLSLGDASIATPLVCPGIKCTSRHHGLMAVLEPSSKIYINAREQPAALPNYSTTCTYSIRYLAYTYIDSIPCIAYRMLWLVHPQVAERPAASRSGSRYCECQGCTRYVWGAAQCGSQQHATPDMVMMACTI